MQVAMSGLLAAPKAEAVYRNASVVSGSGLAGHPRVVYDVFRTAGEWWADFSKAETIDGGICQVKAACAVDSGCDGFVYRIRDGAGLLGRGLRVMDKASPATKSKVNRFAVMHPPTGPRDTRIPRALGFFPGQLEQIGLLHKGLHQSEGLGIGSSRRIGVGVPEGGAPVHVQSHPHAIPLGLRHQRSQGRRRWSAGQRDGADQKPASPFRQSRPVRIQGSLIEGLISKSGTKIAGKTLKHPFATGIAAHQHHP